MSPPQPPLQLPLHTLAQFPEHPLKHPLAQPETQVVAQPEAHPTLIVTSPAPLKDAYPMSLVRPTVPFALKNALKCFIVILRADCSFVAEAALPEQAADVPPLAAAVIVMFAVPSNPTPLIVRFVCSFVAEAALPENASPCITNVFSGPHAPLNSWAFIS